MSHRRFVTQLIVLTALVASIISGLHQLPEAQDFRAFSWLSLLLFAALTVIMYIFARRAARSDNKYAFINFLLAMTFFKMLLAVSIALVYKFKAPEPSMLFIALFLGIYVVYTIFETYFMTQLSNMKEK